jgi:hypothetical protein
MNGGFGTPDGSYGWRADATPRQLARAAAGLQQIAETCAGRRREELLELADGLRERASARAAVERDRDVPLRLLTGAS